MNIPKRLTAGDSATWLDAPWVDSASRQCLTSDAWTLTYQVRGPAELTLVAQANGGGWSTSLAMEQSAALIPGTYVWAAYLSQPGQRMCIAGGTLNVALDLTTVTDPIDTRSLAEKALADCEAALAKFNSQGGMIKRYSIASRETEFQSLQDLMRLRDFWQVKVNNERARQSIRNGRGNPRTLKVRFQ